MPRCIMIVNCMPKIVVVVENHCKCHHLFLLFMIYAHVPLHHPHSTILSIQMSGYRFALYLLINDKNN